MKEEFKCLLRPELLLEISDQGILKVKESDKSAKLKKLIIHKIPDGSVAFELDHDPSGSSLKGLKEAFKQFSCLINSRHTKANKSCDFVIVSPNEQCSRIVLGELKSAKPKKYDCSEQLRNSELFIEYLLKLLAEYHHTIVVPDFQKVVFYVPKPINQKSLTQQNHSRKHPESEGVTYYPVNVGGWNNEETVITCRNGLI